VSLPIDLREEAQVEFDEAFDWYNAQKPGLGLDFVAEIQRVFNRIAANPLMYPLVLKDIRKGVVRRFPYSIYYRLHLYGVEVIAVFHSSRNPMVWQSRASKPRISNLPPNSIPTVETPPALPIILPFAFSRKEPT
jgi:plasmid stabilization system protein ParE